MINVNNNLTPKKQPKQPRQQKPQTKLIKILVDTREQAPFKFEGYEDIITRRETLPAGDYAIVGQDMPGDDFSLIIERKKNAMELVTNLCREWERFENEAQKLAQYKHRQIVVCGPDNFAYLYDRRFTLVAPNLIYSRLAYLYLHYNISTVFFEDRPTAENYTYRLIKHAVWAMEKMDG